jgi:hypothetical protein
MKIRAVLCLLLFLSSLGLLLSAQVDTKEGPKSNDHSVREYVAAYNERKLDSMLEMVTEDIEWLHVAGNKLVVESAGKAQLRKGMEGYFKSLPSSKSELLWTEVTPTRVATLEKATWQSKSGEKSQVSLAVYEFRDELISRVYYYPAEKPTEDRTKR